MKSRLLTDVIYQINRRLGIDITDRGRRQYNVFGRTIFLKIATEYYGGTLKEVASYVNRDHATYIHHKKMFKELEKMPIHHKVYLEVCKHVRHSYKDYEGYENALVTENDNLLDVKLLKLELEVERLRDDNHRMKKLLESYDTLEDHEIKYRSLTTEKQLLFKARVNPILKMI